MPPIISSLTDYKDKNNSSVSYRQDKLKYQQTDSFGWNSALLNKFILYNQNKTINLWRFDLFQRHSSEEAGTRYKILGIKDQTNIYLKSVHSQPFRTQVCFYRSRYSGEPCDQLGEGNSDWQRARTVPPGRSRSLFTSVRKVNKKWIRTRAAINSAIRTTTLIRVPASS